MRTLILCLFLLTNTFSFSDEKIVNGCGPGWKELYLLAPNKIKLLGIDFTSACNLHDICYGNSLMNYVKDNEGLTRYDFNTNNEQRIYCDNNFQRDMTKQCSTLPIVEKTLCHSLAISYFATVVVSGRIAFKNDPNIKEQPLRLKDFFSLEKTQINPDKWGVPDTDTKKEYLSQWFSKETPSDDTSGLAWLKHLETHNDSGWGKALEQIPAE